MQCATSNSTMEADWLMHFISVVYPVATIALVVGLFVLFLIGFYGYVDTFLFLSHPMRSKCKRNWFYDLAKCLEQYHVVHDLPSSHELDMLCTLAATAEKRASLLTRVNRLLNSTRKLHRDDQNPAVRRIQLRTLKCRPDPAKYGCIFPWKTFRYSYLGIYCEDSFYRFGYQYDYRHKKPTLLRLLKEESLFDAVVALLDKQGILAELHNDHEVKFASRITLKELIIALHIPYVLGNKIRVSAAFEMISSHLQIRNSEVIFPTFIAGHVSPQDPGGQRHQQFPYGTVLCTKV